MGSHALGWDVSSRLGENKYLSDPSTTSTLFHDLFDLILLFVDQMFH